MLSPELSQEKEEADGGDGAPEQKQAALVVDPLSMAGGPYCSAHPPKKIEAYCEQCRRPVCMQCILRENHKNHDILSLQDASAKERDNFAGMAARLAELREEIAKQVTKCQS